jgi:hypothetical protein
VNMIAKLDFKLFDNWSLNVKNMKMNPLCQTFGLEIGVVNWFSSNPTIELMVQMGSKMKALDWIGWHLIFLNWKDYLRRLQMVDIFWPIGTKLEQQGVCYTVALPFTLKSIWRQKKNYGNSNISSCKNIIFEKSSKRNQNPSRYYSSIINLKFQHKPKYHLSEIPI